MYHGIHDVEFLDAYFESTKGGAVEDVSWRFAGYLEVAHLAHIASRDWQLFWNGKLGGTLKEPLMYGTFFQSFSAFAFETGSTTTVLTYALTCLPQLITIYGRLYRGKQKWPFHVITKCEAIPDEKEQLGKFRPRSDLLVSKSNLPRLLVEVNSNPRQTWPEDLVRMLLTGAAVVRIANRLLDRFMATKNYVLCAIYVWDNGEVTRYSLFQEFNTPEVCWTSYITNLAG